NLSHGCVNQKSQNTAAMASAGTICIPGKYSGRVFSGIGRRSKGHTPAKQSKYINSTATFESTANCSKLEQTERTKASAEYTMIATSGERKRGCTCANQAGNTPSRPMANSIRGELKMSLATKPNAETAAPMIKMVRPVFPMNVAAASARGVLSWFAK